MIKRARICLLIFFIILFYAADKSSAYNFADRREIVRISVIKNTPKISLKIKSPYRISTLHTGQLINDGRRLRSSFILPTTSGIKIGEDEFKVFGVNITPKKDATIYIDKKRFRGSVDIIRTEDLKLSVINHIDVEDYLRGVLYNEVSHWWPMAVLEAQAIAARAYALYQKSVRTNRDYDLTSDTYSQVYGGFFSERWKTDRAVKRTKGKVLTYKGKIFPTYYHATCGGHTENSSNLWNIDMRPLNGGKCTFCTKSPHYFWERSITLKDITAKLKKAGFDVGRVDAIKIIDKFHSRRVKNVEVRSQSAVLTIPAKDFRRAIGNNVIRSGNFKVNIKGSKVNFEGYGWGHGVGMCQWGAYFMSKRHFKAPEILRFYYPGSSIQKKY